jgi:hypothetical protein
MNARPSRTRPSLFPCKTTPAALVWCSAALAAFAPALYAQSSRPTLPDAPSTLIASAAAIPQQLPSVDTESSSANIEPQQSQQSQTQSTTQPLPPLIAAPGTQTSPPPRLSHKQQQTADILLASTLPPCPVNTKPLPIIFLPQTSGGQRCREQDQLQTIVDSGNLRPLTPTEKGVLAIRAVTDPFNLLTIVAFSGFSIAFDSHSVYGAGFGGWGRLAGYSLAEDIQGEATGTFLLPVLFHEDPRYHRVPNKPLLRRIEHALVHTVISQHDDGSLMLNYATLINYPLSAEISNLYVPGLPTNAPSTAKRVALGYATDPIGPLVAEFLPDLARRVHIHIVFAQQILNRIALGNNNAANSPL